MAGWRAYNPHSGEVESGLYDRPFIVRAKRPYEEDCSVTSFRTEKEANEWLAKNGRHYEDWVLRVENWNAPQFREGDKRSVGHSGPPGDREAVFEYRCCECDQWVRKISDVSLNNDDGTESPICVPCDAKLEEESHAEAR
jgi:hypothetical protein